MSKGRRNGKVLISQTQATNVLEGIRTPEDYYLGRLVKGSAALVDLLRGIDNTVKVVSAKPAEQFDVSEATLVIPLLRRLFFAHQGEAPARSLLWEASDRRSQLKEPLSLRATKVVAAHFQHGVSQVPTDVIQVLFDDTDIEAKKAFTDDKLAVDQAAGIRSAVPLYGVRVAEVHQGSDTTDQIIELMSSQLIGHTVELGSLTVCRVSAKTVS